jgi:very-short-patch-repair endonuclease
VEIDGPLHDVERDLTRDAWLLARGVTTLRYADEELDIEAIVRDVLARA